MSKRKTKPSCPKKAAPPSLPQAQATLPTSEALETIAKMLERLVEEIRVLKTFT